MNSNPFDRNEYVKRLTDTERNQLIEKLQQALDWIDEYDQKEPILRSQEDKKKYLQKSSETAVISHQLSQHALIVLNQVAYLLTDTMEVMEIAMDIDPSDDDKYYTYCELRKSYVKFMKAFKREFRNN